MTSTTTGTGLIDTFNMEIHVGDRVRLTSYGWNARLIDVGSVVTITGATRHGTLTHDSEEVASGKPLRGACVGILTETGGYRGNVAH